MAPAHIHKISIELGLQKQQVTAVHELLAEGATIPFIARYRKEVTNSLDEVAVTAIRDRLAQLEQLENRRISILESLYKNGHLTDELKAEVEASETLLSLIHISEPTRPTT